MRAKPTFGVGFCVVIVMAATIIVAVGLQAQETTGGLQGTVKDANGAVVPKASVELTGASLVGSKKVQTDGSGYYRFANIPPGTYSLTVRATGFAALKRDGITIEVGHLPTLDLALKVGSAETVIEVSAEVPLIDVTTSRTATNITQDVIADVPHGRSFQSVIQFAPSARNEPLAGSATYGSAGGTGTGGNSPGNGGNGGAFGFSVGGGSDSENSYLVEGQETANIIGGFSHTNVPFEFIQEVQVKTSGVEAEHGGALGGVVNVVMKRGSNKWHGEVGTAFEFNGMDGSPVAYTRYDPNGSISGATQRLDVGAQGYQPKRDGGHDIQPVFAIGGPVWKDRIFAFAAIDPEFNSLNRTVNFGTSSSNPDMQHFSRDTKTYYATARIDAKVGSRLNVFGSWLYQYQRQEGEVLPFADSTAGLYNVSTSSPLIAFSHAYGYSAPNQTINVGADLTISPKIVSTTRFGYYFENYHDFGFPTTGTLYFFQSSGGSGQTCTAPDLEGGVASTCNSGTALTSIPAAVAGGLIQPNGYYNIGNNQNFTIKNADKHVQFDQDIAWFKSGWGGTHNFKFGYQLNRISNDIFQRWNAPEVQIFPGQTNYSYINGIDVAGTYGSAIVQDFGTEGKATSYNHAFFAQDSWTIGKGLTVIAGIRFEHENVPSENNTEGTQAANPINFGWGSKIAPRLGFAWDVFRDGKAKVFGSYGVFNDMMKLNLAISSFGGQFWDNCLYLMNDPNIADIVPVRDASGRYCNNSSGGDDTTLTANLQPITPPAGVTPNAFIENINFRGNEGVVAGLKPYRQHESVFGFDYRISDKLAFEARWDRRRLDHAIEDAALFSQGNEVFSIVNPGEGPNATNTFCGSACPNNVKAARSYDGLEFRLTKESGNHWFGMLSYTYSRLRGNYAGLTNTDLSDGGGGRNSPNNSRAFDETYFQYTANGTPFNGPLATDRPNTFKGYAYYQLPWGGKRASTNIGWFQTLYQGTPLSSYIDVGAWTGYPVDPEGRGKWATITQDANGILTVTSVGTRRTPWYNQSDLSFTQEFKINKNHENQTLAFEATINNLLNTRSVTSYGSQINSTQAPSNLTPGGNSIGTAEAYAAYEHPYDWKTLLNTDGIILNSQYGQPLSYQLARTIRLKVRFTF